MQSHLTFEPSRTSARLSLGALAALALAMMLIVAPWYASAQNDTSLRGDMNIAIKSAILSDPRSQSLSLEEINVISLALTQQAQAQGMTQHDLLWRPALAHTVAPLDEAAYTGNDCGKVPTVLCGVNRSIGLPGSDMTIVVMLSVLLVLILAATAGYLELQHRNKMRLQAQV
ncbi:hypothetical protein HYT05_01370 [Candidatus Kaiserbacteria bacterium]|nr:hypothetical protein [Candidatus Kaiserbacteria bacterium]